MQKRFIAVVVAVAALAGALCLVVRRPAMPKWTLPDGSTLRVLKVTWGTNHTCCYGNPLADYLYPLVPQKYRSQLNLQVARYPVGRRPTFIADGHQVFTGSYASGDLVVWVLWQNNSAGRGFPVLTVVDGCGVESGEQCPLEYISAANGGTTNLYASAFSRHPRRAQSVNIRIDWESMPGSTFVGEFSVPNHVRRDLPVWQPEQLPATRSFGDLDLKLLELKTGSRKEVFGRGEETDICSRARYVVRDNGAVSNRWQVRKVFVKSAAGEERQASGWSLGRDVDEAWIHGSLWLDEPAWKITFQLTNHTLGQTRTAEFLVKPMLVGTNADGVK